MRLRVMDEAVNNRLYDLRALLGGTHRLIQQKRRHEIALDHLRMTWFLLEPEAGTLMSHERVRVKAREWCESRKRRRLFINVFIREGKIAFFERFLHFIERLCTKTAEVTQLGFCALRELLDTPHTRIDERIERAW